MMKTAHNSVYIDSGQGLKEAKPYDPKEFTGPILDAQTGKSVEIDSQTGRPKDINDLHSTQANRPYETSIGKAFRFLKERVVMAIESALTLAGGSKAKISEHFKTICDLNNREPSTEKLRKLFLAAGVALGGLFVAKEAVTAIHDIGSDKPRQTPWIMQLMTIIFGVTAVKGSLGALTSDPKTMALNNPKTVLKSFALFLASLTAESACNEGSVMDRLMSFFGGKTAFRDFIGQFT